MYHLMALDSSYLMMSLVLGMSPGCHNVLMMELDSMIVGYMKVLLCDVVRLIISRSAVATLGIEQF